LQQEHEDAELRKLWNELRREMLVVFTQAAVTSQAAGDSAAACTTIDSIRQLIERYL